MILDPHRKFPSSAFICFIVYNKENKRTFFVFFDYSWFSLMVLSWDNIWPHALKLLDEGKPYSETLFSDNDDHYAQQSPTPAVNLSGGNLSYPLPPIREMIGANKESDINAKILAGVLTSVAD